MRLTATTLLVAVVIAAPALAVGPPSEYTPAEVVLARTLAAQFKTKVTARVATSATVAVFPVGNAEGRVTHSLYEPSLLLQAEIIHELSVNGGDRINVLTRSELAEKFKGVDLDSLKSSEPRKAATILKGIEVDVAVFAGMDATKPGDFGPDGKVNVNLKIVFADAGVASGGGKGPPDLLPPSNLVPSKRFNVELLVGGRPLELVTSKDESSEYHNVFFAVVPKELRLGTEEAEYQIRLTNRGEPGLPFENERDRERLFAAAVTIDGVNSIWQEGAGGRIGPVSRHPQFLTKWVLSGPGQRVEFLRNGAHRLVGAPADRDGSRVTVAGYQVKGETRKRFVFGSAEESVAVRSGVTHEIGVITVYFFAQKLKDDHVYTSRPVNVGGPDAPPLGTLAGREERNLVQPIRLELYEQPTEVWRIFYRREGDRFPVPPDDRIPVTDVLEGKRTPEV